MENVKPTEPIVFLGLVFIKILGSLVLEIQSVELIEMLNKNVLKLKTPVKKPMGVSRTDTCKICIS